MPRNSSGVYQLPAGNPVVTGTLIESVWANNTLADVGTALTESLDRFGRSTMAAALKLMDGTVAAPGLSFNSQASLGILRDSANVLAIGSNGVKVATFSNTAISFLVPVSGLTLSGRILTDDGTAAQPSHSFTNATGVGMFLSNGATDLSFARSGGERMRIATGRTDMAGLLIVGPTAAIIGSTQPTNSGSVFERLAGSGALMPAGTAGTGLSLFGASGGSSPVLLQISSDATAIAGIQFGDTAAAAQGFISYDNTLDLLRLGAGGVTNRLVISPTWGATTVGTLTNPSTSGSTQEGTARFTATSTSLALDFGVMSGGPTQAWLQARNTGNFATVYPLALNPNGGNVGVGLGTTSAATAFHVKGGSAAEVRAESSGDLTTTGTALYRLAGSNGLSGYFGFGGFASQLDIVNALNGSIAFWTNGTVKARISADGKVGIGRTATTYQQEIQNSLSVTDDTTTWRVATSGAAASMGTASAHPLLFLTGGAEAARLTTTNQLRINGTALGGQLVVREGAAGYGGGGANSAIDGIVLESNGGTGISILVPDGQNAQIQFGDVTSNARGGIVWAGATPELRLQANTVDFGVRHGDAAITYSIGFRGIPYVGGFTGTLAAVHNGKKVAATGTITVPAGLTSDYTVTIFNDTGAARTIAQGAGHTMTWAGPGTTGSRTLANGGLCTITYTGASSSFISGAGLS